MLLLITATFSRCFGVTSSCKGTETKLESIEGRLQNLGDYKIITLRPLVVPSLSLGATAQGLRVINSVDP